MDNELLLNRVWLIPSREGRLEDHYDINMSHDLIGTGSFARVVKATTKEGHHPRAIKILRKERINDKEKFKAEIEILKQLDHPNVVRLYETFEDPRNVYLVMELCKGGEVFDRIIEKGHFTESEARKVFTQMVHAVSYCHANGICHRDLKPENFMYMDKTPDAHIKVIDFGLAKIFVDTHSKNREKIEMTDRVGTSYYISPEVLAGSYDESCDIWSIGVILYILLCGYPPFNGKTDAEILLKIKKGSYSLKSAEWKGVSDSAKDLISRILCSPSSRLHTKDILRHPWMLQEENRQEKPLKMNYQLLKNFTDYRKLKKIAMTIIASQMSEEEIMGLSEQFIKLDKNGDGVLTFEEMQSGINELSGKSVEEVKRLMDSVDTDKSGTINYTEFITATMEKSMYLKEDKLIEAFKMFDKDGNGKITVDELREILENDHKWRHEKSYYEQIIKEADLDEDGAIDYHDFIEMMKRN